MQGGRRDPWVLWARKSPQKVPRMLQEVPRAESAVIGGHVCLMRMLMGLLMEHGMLNGEHESHETCHSLTFYFITKDSKRCCDTTTPESIHTKDESKHGSAFAFIFGVN